MAEESKAATNKGKGADNEEEEKGFFATICDFFGMIFKGIFWVLYGIFMGIVYVIQSIGACLQFIWYPIKERCAVCCRWCRRRNVRSEDPTYSTFDNEV